MTYIDRLNLFFRTIIYEPLSSSEQLVYLHLLNINNQLQWTTEFKVTDNRLAINTGLSKDAITKAKRNLKNKGWIDFTTDKKNPRNGSTYRLPYTGLSLSDISAANSSVKSHKKGQDNRNENPQGDPVIKFTPDSQLTLHENKEKEEDLDRDRDCVLSSFEREKKLPRARVIGTANANTQREHAPVNEPVDLLDAINQMWQDCGGRALKGENALFFIKLAQNYGLQFVLDTINEADGSNNYPNLSRKYFELVLNSKLKGGEKTGNNRRHFEGTAEKSEFINIPETNFDDFFRK